MDRKPQLYLNCLSGKFLVIHISLVGLVLGKSPQNGGSISTWPLAVDWGVKHQFKQTNKQTNNNFMPKNRDS